MAKWIKNDSGSNKTWLGQTVLDQEYYNIQPHEESLWANNSSLMSDISAGNAIVAKDDSGSNNITDINDAINYLKDDIAKEVTINSQQPFAAKTLTNGKKLYARTHGEEFSVSAGANTLNFSVPYAACKMNGIELFAGEFGDKIDLYIKDDASGTYSTVPNYTLNQFGFNANVAKDFYHRESNYDADLYVDMVISVEYNSESAKTVYINYLLHEVKD